MKREVVRLPRKRNPNQDKAFEIYQEHSGNITNREIARLLGEDEKVIAVWKKRNNWKVVQQSKESCTTKKRGGQPGNHNATGPPKNDNAVKHGLFRKWLPAEAVSIIEEMPKDPLDVLWDQIQIAYAAIIRAQQIMYVRDRDDVTTTKIGQKDGDTVTEERWEVQQAWDKQANFLKSQARAQSELRSLVKQYDEMLHRNWDLATKEQKARIEQIRAQTEAIKKKSELGEADEFEDDGFMDALKGNAVEDWADEETDI